MTNATLIKNLGYDLSLNVQGGLASMQQDYEFQFILPMSESLKHDLIVAQEKVDTRKGILTYKKYRSLLSKKYGV